MLPAVATSAPFAALASPAVTTATVATPSLAPPAVAPTVANFASSDPAWLLVPRDVRLGGGLFRRSVRRRRARLAL